MSVVLQTGVMYYRENQSDDWHPLILKVDADLSSFIEDYSQRTWELGEYCRYHDVIYRCTTAIETAEAWDSTHWTATDVGEELKALNDDLDETKNTLNSKADKAELSALTRTGATNTGTQIESGTYFYLDGTLKRATQTIANGSAFTSSNCVSVTVGEELTTLNSGLTNLIKSALITGVTDSSGNIAITGIDMIQNYIISVIGNTGYAVGIIASGGVYYAKIVGNTNPITPLANTSITLYIRYL